jgi:8-oxo-dGTP pyrophosphatase MutT (NUDIX family)
MPHIHEKIDFTVEVYIVHNDTVLLRKHDKYKMWLSVGGHIEPDEDPIEAAIREVKEEVGLNVIIYSGNKTLPCTKDYRELIPPEFMNRHRINEQHEHVTLVYFAISSSNKAVALEEKRGECKWFKRADIDRKAHEIQEHVRTYSKAALDTIRNNNYSC